jgi:hypothetical protein
MIQFLNESAQVPYAVIIAVMEGTNEDLIADGTLLPVGSLLLALDGGCGAAKE